jgi:hypothetical protein
VTPPTYGGQDSRTVGVTKRQVFSVIDLLNTSIAHTSLLSNAHGAWPMFGLFSSGVTS